MGVFMMKTEKENIISWFVKLKKKQFKVQHNPNSNVNYYFILIEQYSIITINDHIK